MLALSVIVCLFLNPSGVQQSQLNLSKLQKENEKIHQKHSSTEDTDAVPAQSYVSTAEFQQ